MDSAEARSIQGVLENNNARMDRQEEQMFATGRAVQALVAQVSELTTQIQHLRMPAVPLPPPVPPAPPSSRTQREPRLPAPEAYNGEPNLCRAFLVKCSMFFSLQPQTFATEKSKVALVLTLLSGKAALWGTAVWKNRHPCCSSFHALSEEMSWVSRSGPILEGGPFHSLAQITFCQGDSGYYRWSRLSHSWPPDGRGFR